MKTTWRSTKKLYRHYINVDPTIDLSDQGISDKGLQHLAALFMPVDERLMNMMRALGCQDTPPESDWPQQFLANYSWLSGVAVLDNAGVVRMQAPSTSSSLISRPFWSFPTATSCASRPPRSPPTSSDRGHARHAVFRA
jgi:hypothetical protein